MSRSLATAFAAALAIALALAVAGCGEKTEAVTGSSGSVQNLTLMLDWFPNADHVGIYQALAQGDFTKADLNVHIEIPSDPADPLKLLAAGKVDAAISYEPEVLLARNQGQPLVSVAAIVQEPLTSIVSIGSKHIKTVAQLRGKTVGDAGIPYQHAYLQTILAHAGVPAASVKEINVGDNLVHASPDLDPKLQLASVRATLPAFFPSDPAHPWGWQDPAQWNAYGEWMLNNHLITVPNAVLDASTNELLAGQGL